MGEGTLADTRGNDEEVPKPVFQGTTQADLLHSLAFSVRMVAHGEDSHRPPYAAVRLGDRPRNSTPRGGR
jgi:hypothetical protein